MRKISEKYEQYIIANIWRRKVFNSEENFPGGRTSHQARSSWIGSLKVMMATRAYQRINIQFLAFLWMLNISANPGFNFNFRSQQGWTHQTPTWRVCFARKCAILLSIFFWTDLHVFNKTSNPKLIFSMSSEVLYLMRQYQCKSEA